MAERAFQFERDDETIKVKGIEIFAVCNVPIEDEGGLTYTAELTPLGSLALSSHADPEPTETKQMEGIYHGQIPEFGEKRNRVLISDYRNPNNH